MLFAAYDALDLPCHFSQLIEGERHHDGRRYLPTIVLTPPTHTITSPVHWWRHCRWLTGIT